MDKFKQKAVEVDARQYTEKNGKELALWVNDNDGVASWAAEARAANMVLPEQLYVITTSGEGALNVGDWIVELEGEFKTYTDAEFKLRFEQV